MVSRTSSRFQMRFLTRVPPPSWNSKQISAKIKTLSSLFKSNTIIEIAVFKYMFKAIHCPLSWSGQRRFARIDHNLTATCAELFD